MKVDFSMFGYELKVFDFLLKAEYFPEDFTLWEDIEVLKDQEPGFTLFFDRNNELSGIPYSVGKFLLANKNLFNDESIVGPGTVSELSIEFKKNIENESAYRIGSGFIKLLSEFNCEVYMRSV